MIPMITSPRLNPRSEIAVKVPIAGVEDETRSRVHRPPKKAQKNIPNPAYHSNKNKHGKGLRKGEDRHGDDIGDEARQDHTFSLIQIQNLPTNRSTQKEHDGNRTKEKAGIGDPIIYRVKREKSSQRSPHEKGNGIRDGYRNRYWIEKGTAPSGRSLQGGSSHEPKFFLDI